jgi:hypothetical protein
VHQKLFSSHALPINCESKIYQCNDFGADTGIKVHNSTGQEEDAIAISVIVSLYFE